MKFFQKKTSLPTQEIGKALSTQEMLNITGGDTFHYCIETDGVPYACWSDNDGNVYMEADAYYCIA